MFFQQHNSARAHSNHSFDKCSWLRTSQHEIFVCFIIIKLFRITVIDQRAKNGSYGIKITKYSWMTAPWQWSTHELQLRYRAYHASVVLVVFGKTSTANLDLALLSFSAFSFQIFLCLTSRPELSAITVPLTRDPAGNNLCGIQSCLQRPFLVLS